jgi:hypothetical protein
VYISTDMEGYNSKLDEGMGEESPLKSSSFILFLHSQMVYTALCHVGTETEF